MDHFVFQRPVYAVTMSKDGSHNSKKKSKKGKVGVINTNFEMEDTAKEKVM